MLYSLHIENVAVVKNINIDFSSGFNVLTGETGAGKSIIIDSIGVILGEKTSKDIIRHGAEKAVVTALFDNNSDKVFELCDEYGIKYDKEDMLSVSRSINSDGKSVAKINSQTVTLAQLRSIGAFLIDIHGQNENHTFMNKASHISLLDEYINSQNILSEYSEIYARLNSIKSEISSLKELNKQKELMLDMLKFQINEIESAKLKSLDEEERLNAMREKLRGAEKIIKQASTVYKAICKNDSGISAVYLIEKALDSLKKLSEFEPSAAEMAERLESYKYEITDIAERTFELASFDGVENPDSQLQVIEARLFQIQKLKKKYGYNIAEILKFKQEAQAKLDALEDGEKRIDELTEEYKKDYQIALEIAKKLHIMRQDGAKKLSSVVKSSLEFLDMPKVKFEISIKETTSQERTTLTQNGIDDVEFMIATNAGEELASMNKIASGGELSRIMLAMKSAMSDKSGAQTVIFDEIDTGVSGSTSQKIGIKLNEISNNIQVICVTHSPQIAALAQTHFFIKKTERDERAEASVSVLNTDERIEEIARIIGGINVTEKQLAAAKELISQSEKIKAQK